MGHHTQRHSQTPTHARPRWTRSLQPQWVTTHNAIRKLLRTRDRGGREASSRNGSPHTTPFANSYARATAVDAKPPAAMGHHTQRHSQTPTHARPRWTRSLQPQWVTSHNRGGREASSRNGSPHTTPFANSNARATALDA